MSQTKVKPSKRTRISVLLLPEMRRFVEQRKKAGENFTALMERVQEQHQALPDAQRDALYQEVRANWPFEASDFDDVKDENMSMLINSALLHFQRSLRSLQ